jgi:hypothetical protein
MDGESRRSEALRFAQVSRQQPWGWPWQAARGPKPCSRTDIRAYPSIGVHHRKCRRICSGIQSTPPSCYRSSTDSPSSWVQLFPLGPQGSQQVRQPQPQAQARCRNLDSLGGCRSGHELFVHLGRICRLCCLCGLGSCLVLRLLPFFLLGPRNELSLTPGLLEADAAIKVQWC